MADAPDAACDSRSLASASAPSFNAGAGFAEGELLFRDAGVPSLASRGRSPSDRQELWRLSLGLGLDLWNRVLSTERHDPPVWPLEHKVAANVRRSRATAVLKGD